jgi:hypothetical protein
MKKSTSLLLLPLLILIFSSNTYSQIGNLVDYLPLHDRNVWVYQNTVFGNPPQCFPCSAKVRFQISGTLLFNGHIYYLATQTGGGCLLPPIPFTSWLRVDSLTGNLLQYTSGSGCNWSLDLTMIDSFKARINDTIKFNCNQPPGYQGPRLCTDTNNFTIFGNSRPGRVYTNFGFEYSENRRYAKGIGLYSTGGGSAACISFTRTLLGCVINGVVYGDTNLTGINKISSEIPEKYSISQNYPNPFNPTTKIRFSIPSPSPLERAGVRLVIYDALGREVQTLVNEQLQPGTYEVEFSATGGGLNLASGIYYYTLSSGNYFETKRMVLIK